MKQMIQRWARCASLCVGVSLLLVACASKQSAPVVERSPGGTSATTPAPAVKPAPGVPSGTDFYTVKRGDTLFGIALDHGQDYREMAAWNNITNPSVIQVGQVLRVTAPAAGGVAGGVAGGAVGESGGGVVVRPVTPSGTAPGAATAPGIITEPRGDKRPYSDEALAQAQRGQSPASSPASPATKPPAEKPAEKPADKPESDDVAWNWPIVGATAGRLIGQFSESGNNKGIDIAAKVGDAVLAAGPGKVVYSGQGLRGYGRLVIIKHNNTYLSAYAHNSNLLVKEGQVVTRGQKIAEAGNTDSDVPKLHFEIRRQGKPVDPLKFLPER